MPELPDVEYFKRYAESTALHQRITKVDLQDTQLLHKTSRKKLLQTLKDRSFESASRHGKYLGLQLSDNGWLVLHFGMTGQPGYVKNPDDAPRFTRLLITFENGYHYAFANQRRLGRIQLVNDFNDMIKQEKLGPDALSITRRSFKNLVTKRRGSLKSFFMNQSNIAGMGNIYTDETLYQSRLHPARSANELNDKTLDRLYDCMQHVLNTAIASQPNAKKMPTDWLLHYRIKAGQCPRCHEPLKTSKLAGRTTYFCPRCQPKPR